MKKTIQILAVLALGFCYQWVLSADAPKAAAVPAATAPASPTLADVTAERDQLKRQVEDLTKALQAIQAQRNQVVSQLLDTQVQLQLANDAIAASRAAPPAEKK